MKASEIRIGNYFEYKKHIIEFAIEDFAEISNNNQFLELFLKPIKLTKQWLKDLGIDKGIGIHNSAFSGLISIKKGSIDWCFYIGDIDIKYIKYVHQLQNLYFALTDKKLKRKS